MPQSLPDAEILARTWALSKTSITDIVDQKVATRLPQDAEMPFLVVTRLGGTPLSGEALIDEALLQLDCYAGKYATNNTKYLVQAGIFECTVALLCFLIFFQEDYLVVSTFSILIMSNISWYSMLNVFSRRLV